MIKFLYLLVFPIAFLYVRKYKPQGKKKLYILILAFCFSLIPFTNNKPKPIEITIDAEPSSVVVLGKDMLKKTTIVLKPENADISKLEYISDDYSVAYIQDGNIHSASEGETVVYAKYKDIISNKIKVIVDYSEYIDLSEEDGYVFKTYSGNKYHTSDCSIINPKLLKITREQAEQQGAEPCKSCFGE